MEFEKEDLQMEKEVGLCLSKIMTNKELKQLRHGHPKALKLPKGILLKPSDKGSSLVAMTERQYLDMVMKHLNDDKTYVEVSNDGLAAFTYALDVIIQELESEGLTAFATYLAVRLKPTFVYRKRQLYVLPKIHKAGYPDGILRLTTHRRRLS